MRRLFVLALATASLAPATAGADSAVVPVAPGDEASPPYFVANQVTRLAGPFLAGDDVVFLERRLRRLTLLADGPAGRRELFALREDPADPRSFSLDVAEGRIALTTFRFSCNGDLDCARYRAESPRDWVVVTGPTSGPLHGVPMGGGTCSLLGADAAADAIAGTCGGSRWAIYQDGGGGKEYSAPILSAPQIAGGYAAAPLGGENGETRGLQVLHRPGMEEAYRIDAPVEAFDLAPDGSVAYTLRDEAAAGWSSPADPAVHRLALPAAATGVSQAAERIAVRMGTNRDERLLVLDRAGAVLGDVTEPAATAGFDYDGARLAWAREPCTRQSVVVWDLSDPVPKRRGDACSAPVTRTRRVNLQPDRSVVVRLVCPATAPAGCAGATGLTVYVRSRASERRRIGGSTAHSFDLLPGQLVDMRVRVARKALRRARIARLEIATDLDHADRPEPIVRRAVRLPRRRR
ncbi:MAG TPA: hypothetical protein VF549_07825 [Solirubrobacteraceae bacterium]|jgi:hypothetical protein